MTEESMIWDTKENQERLSGLQAMTPVELCAEVARLLSSGTDDDIRWACFALGMLGYQVRALVSQVERGARR